MSLYRDNKFKIKLNGKYYNFFKEAPTIKEALKIINEDKKEIKNRNLEPCEYKITKESDLFGNSKHIVWKKIIFS